MFNVKEGEFTSKIYGLIRDKKYKEAINILTIQFERHPGSRAARSLLGYCHYQIQNFVEAADCYEFLSKIFPEVKAYKLYFAQSLFKAGMYELAMKESAFIEDSEFTKDIIKLQASILYQEGDLSAARLMVSKLPKDDSDTLINSGCLLFKEGDYAGAQSLFEKAMYILGFRPFLTYNLAVCHYMRRQYAPSLKYIADVIEKGIKEHTELGVGMTTEGIEVRSVGNTMTLHDTALVETFNLKAAIEYNLNNIQQACEALTDMPPRNEEELDPVTLHNIALMNMTKDVNGGFQKLQFILQQESFPAETFGNLVLLYIKYEQYHLAADLMAMRGDYSEQYLTPELYEFIEAVILRQTAPEEAYVRLEEMVKSQTDIMRKLTKRVQEARKNHDDETLKNTINEYDDSLEKYIPILMQQAKIYWDRGNYLQVEKIFRNSVEFCSDHEAWKLNVAHVLYMQGDKYNEASGFYEPIVKKHYDNILNVSAIVLANLCVSYIMISRNEDAEELMKKIEKEEEILAYEDPDRKIFHLCIVNLVIGTLYCAKGNYEFGISRVIKCLENNSKKLGTDTWTYVKRCFLSLIENMAKHMIIIPDAVLNDCLKFLHWCEKFGRNVQALVEPLLDEERIHPGRNTVTYEARHLKYLMLQLVDG